MNLLQKNQNTAERVQRFIVSLFMLPAPVLLGNTTYSLLLCSVGAVLLFNSLSGICMIYRIMGANTCKI